MSTVVYLGADDTIYVLRGDISTYQTIDVHGRAGECYSLPTGSVVEVGEVDD